MINNCVVWGQIYNKCVTYQPFLWKFRTKMSFFVSICLYGLSGNWCIVFGGLHVYCHMGIGTITTFEFVFNFRCLVMRLVE